jgi:hypothetical protein
MDRAHQSIIYVSFLSWVLIILLYLIRHPIIKRIMIKKGFFSNKPEFTYILFFLLWIGIIGILPCIHLYKTVYNKEQDLWNLTEVSETAQLLEIKIKDKAAHFCTTFRTTGEEALYHVLSTKPNQDTILLDKINGYYLDKVSGPNPVRTWIVKNGVRNTLRNPDSIPVIDQIYKTLRINIRSFSENNYSLLQYPQHYRDVKDTLKYTNDLSLSKPFEKAGIISEYNPSRFLTLSDRLIFYPEKGTFLQIFFTVLLLILFIYFLWRLLVFILKNVAYYQFLGGVIDEHESCISGYLISNGNKITHRVYKPIYVFELNPGKKKYEDLKTETLRELVKKPESADFKVIHCTSFDKVRFDDKNLYLGEDKAINYQVKHVLINNLDYDIGNAQIFKNRLKILEWLYQHKSIRVTITSSFSLKRFEEIYLQLCQSSSGDITETKRLESAWYKWIFLLRKFRFRIEPIKMIFGDEEVEDEIENKEIEEIKDFTEEADINNELNTLSFAWQSIYNDLDFKEKILLLDLVKDGIINIKNKYALRSLCRKGLIQFRGKDETGSILEKPILKIKRNSFRKFISQLAEQGETKEIIDTIEKRGNWSSIKYLLIILIIGLAIFLGVVEQSIFDRFTALLGAAAAVIPLIFKLSQSFLFKAQDS